MKDFELTKKMISLGGAFYPSGFAVIMFPDIEDARQAARELEPDIKGIMLLTPETILKEIGHTEGDSDIKLPAVGTEGATTHKYVELAREGHAALMIPTHTRGHTERIMTVVRKLPFSYGQKYHFLAIEDLE